MPIPDPRCTGLAVALLMACAAPDRPPEPPPPVGTDDPSFTVPSFRAVGQEPGWLVEVFGRDSIRFLLDYGETLFTTPAPVPDSSASTLAWQATGPRGAIVLRATREPCTDAMSGDPFPARVTLTLGERVLTGCGRWP